MLLDENLTKNACDKDQLDTLMPEANSAFHPSGVGKC